MSIKYYSLGAKKKLNEIVVAGSHDAGITTGGANAKTQALDIKGQAEAGVRVFDLRITAATGAVQHGLGKEAELKAFHAAPIMMKNEAKTRYMPDFKGNEEIDRTKLHMNAGTFGEGLSKMLADARDFVTANTEEFLILKFDKCLNWPHIAESCVRVLDNSIYRGVGNVNTKSLDELKGKVIVVFTEKGLTAVRRSYPLGSGILGITNLSGEEDSSAYKSDYNGIQYFGKGGTSIFKPFFKIGQNKKTQAKLMEKGASNANPNVLGMMYWTTTGVFESIRDRNEEMWNESNVAALRKLWSKGLADSIESRLAKNIDPTSYGSGGMLKAFMPNIVMIDFADEDKCQTIYDLNSVASTSLTAAARIAKKTK